VTGEHGPAFSDLAEEARQFFERRAARKAAVVHGWGQGSDEVLGVATRSGDEERAEVAAARVWQAELYDAGLAWVDGPPEYGGRGLTPAHARLVRGIAAEYAVPNTSCFMVSHDIVGPTILAHGTPEQKRRWLPALWRGDVIACQLFSEPEAGSDLASLRTTAVRDGDTWVVTGQKVWSSGAHYSGVGELLARTGPASGRHRSITAFLVDMSWQGIDVRPLRQITGSEHFNEVFFDSVRIPDAERLGPENGGWQVARTTLGGERSLMADEHNGILDDPVRRLFALARHTGADRDPAVLERLGEAWLRDQVLHVTGDRLEAAEGAPPGSVVKLLMTGNMEFFIGLAGRLLGYRMIADTGEWGTYAWSHLLLGAPAHRIAGGTDEIQKNIIAERVLGLPREPRPTSASSA
jgi:alkylation response protein AidB-like acyl-CoA dehydrogenase